MNPETPQEDSSRLGWRNSI